MAPLLLLILLFSSSSLSSSAAFTSATSYFLNCGSTTSTPTSDTPARTFTPDSQFLDSGSSNSNPISTANSTSPSPLYSTARAFTSAASYRFPINSTATHILRLHFSPFSSQTSAARFDVSTSPQRLLLLSNFSTQNSTTVKEFLLWVGSANLVLTFAPHPSSTAFVNAIELFTAPPNFVNFSSATPVQGNQQVDKSPNQPLESVHRINVGGPLVTPANDTVWRTWLPDDAYILKSSVSVIDNTTTNQVKYGYGDPRYTQEIAPASVYSTARSMNLSLLPGNPNFNFNLTWSFGVTPRSTYYIRLHFCDFVSPDVNQLYFNVYIGDQLAYPNLNPGSFVDQFNAAAFYVDFAAQSTDSTLLNVSVGRGNLSTPTTANALLNGLEIMKVGLPSSSDSGGGGGGGGGGVSIVVIVGSVVGGLVAVAILFSLLWLCRRRRQPPKPEAKRKESSMWSPLPGSGDAGGGGGGGVTSSYTLSSKTTDPNATPKVNLGLHIPFAEIRFATNDFAQANIIGVGGFGKVYKGVLRDGTKVAVKRGVPESKQGYPEFHAEIQVLSKIRHRHLVSLIGYCGENSEMILVYEFMENGPLRDYLYGSKDRPCLSWKQRLEICIGAARGLHYLHTGYSHNIIHRDVKSTNILLGEDLVAKVSDFGLSKQGPALGETHVSTVVKGTLGYLDPEYFKVQKLTDKSDVYSFGVTLFEVLCARPVINQSAARDQANLAEWAVLMLRRGQLGRIVDPRLAGRINANSLRTFGETAERCLAEYGVDRPAIGDVLWNLEYALQLQETELRREAFEDSGNVESEIPVNALGQIDHEGDGSPERVVEEGPQSGVTTSTVFSQLMTHEGR